MEGNLIFSCIKRGIRHSVSLRNKYFRVVLCLHTELVALLVKSIFKHLQMMYIILEHQY